MVDALARRLRATLASGTEPRLWTRSFLLVCTTHLLVYGSYAAVHPTFAAYLETITNSESLVGLAFGAFTFAAVLARPLTGRVLDRVGRRGVQATAAVGFALATLSYTWAAVIWTAVLLRVLHGLAWGVSSTATPTIAADVVPAERRSEGFAYFGVVPNLALIAMPPVGLWVAHEYGFGAQFAGAALLALFALVPLAALGETTPSTSSSGELYAREAVPAAALVALAGVPVGAVDALLPLYGPTVGLANAGLFFTVMGAAIAFARAIRGWIPGSTPLLLSSSFALQAGGLALLALAPRIVAFGGRPLGILASAAVFGFGFALIFPLLQTVAVSAIPDERNGSATATVLIGLDVGIGVGAIAFGVLAETAGYAAVYATAAALSLGGAIVVLLVRSRLGRDSPA